MQKEVCQLCWKNWNHIKKIKAFDATLHIATPNYGLEFFEEHYADYINNFHDIKFYGSMPQRQLYGSYVKV